MLKKLESGVRGPGLDFRGLQAVTHRRRMLEETLVGDVAADVAGEDITAKSTKRRNTNRWIRSHILSNTGGVTDLAMEVVLINTVRGCGLADMAGTARKHQLIVGSILLGVQQVGAIGEVSEMFRSQDMPTAIVVSHQTWTETYHSRQNLK
jgi:hypothetical protein